MKWVYLILGLLVLMFFAFYVAVVPELQPCTFVSMVRRCGAAICLGVSAGMLLRTAWQLDREVHL